jgi:putative ABC transport system substrate-binding protein
LRRRAANCVEARGPVDLPVELPTTCDLAVNMKTAKALGIEISNSILVRADKVIE